MLPSRAPRPLATSCRPRRGAGRRLVARRGAHVDTLASSATVAEAFVPVLDVSSFQPGQPRGAAAHEELCDRLEAAFQEAGFCVVTGHGVSSDTIAQAKQVCRSFFSLPLEEKRAIEHLRKGYIPVGGCANQVRPSALHEKWSCNRVDGVGDAADPYFQNELYFGDANLWPAAPAQFEPVMRRYYGEMEALTARLLSLVATVLGAPAGFFEDKMDKHVTNLVALRYPPQDEEPAAGEMRAKPHTDPTVLTILTHDIQPGLPSGLEVLADSRGGVWQPVPVVADGLVVNVGDLLHRWSGGTFHSAKHRVVNGGDDRLAISYFAMPNYDAEVAPLPGVQGARQFSPIRAADISHFTQLEREKQGLQDPQLLEQQKATE